METPLKQGGEGGFAAHQIVQASVAALVKLRNDLVARLVERGGEVRARRQGRAGMFDAAGEAKDAAGEEGERPRLVRQDLVRCGAAAEFLDRGVFDVAGRADRRGHRPVVDADVGGDRGFQRA